MQDVLYAVAREASTQRKQLRHICGNDTLMASASSVKDCVSCVCLCACRWLAVYGGLTGGVIIVALLRASLFFWATMVAATRMHNSMIVRVLRAPLAFFHTNPAGRVLNRFSNDQVRQFASFASELCSLQRWLFVAVFEACYALPCNHSAPGDFTASQVSVAY